MNFKTIRFLFIISIVLIGIFAYFALINFRWILLPFLIFVGIVAYGSANIGSSFFTKVTCFSGTRRKEIAITFDDGPHQEFTPEVLSVLSEFKAKATFFLIGKKCHGNEQLLSQMVTSGHILGNHTLTHSFFIDLKSYQGFINELSKTSEIIFNITGKRIRLFRPPFGVTTPNLAKASEDLKYEIIGWNIRSLDTSSDSETIIAKRVIGKIKPGAIILLHDTSQKTVQVLRQILKFVGDNGYEIVNLDQLLNIEAYGDSGQ